MHIRKNFWVSILIIAWLIAVFSFYYYNEIKNLLPLV